jgi:alpha-tubulin suppressor-like RCC1 family protein
VVPDAFVVPDAWAPDACVATTGYIDVDRDGYTVVARGCSVMGTIGLGVDCDDTNATRHPGAADVCDAVDSDCDGVFADPDPACAWGCVHSGAGAVCAQPAEAATGNGHTCIRTEPTGEVWCWGVNNAGQCGSPPYLATDMPVVTPRLATSAFEGALSICAGNYYTCVARGALGLTCFGSVFGAATPPTSSENVVEVACGELHMCYRTASGAVDCLGLNGDGQVGRVPAGPGLFMMPNRVILSGADEVSVGRTFSCARMSGGQVQCWGGNSAGQLGRGSLTPAADPMPMPVLGGAVFRDLALTQLAGCALTDTELRCWGDASWAGVAGQATSGAFPTPMSYTTMGFTRIEGGYASRFFAFDVSNAAWAWGHDKTGVLARTPRTVLPFWSSAPAPVYPLPAALGMDDVANSSVWADFLGQSGHACGIETDTHRVYCWGSNTRSQCGRPISGPFANAVEVTP